MGFRPQQAAIAHSIPRVSHSTIGSESVDFQRVCDQIRDKAVTHASGTPPWLEELLNSSDPTPFGVEMYVLLDIASDIRE